MPGTITVTASSLATSAYCPECAQVTSTTHGYHKRYPRDLPCDGRSVILKLRVRRFRCMNSKCSKLTFVERFSDWLPTFSRWTKRAAQLIQHVGLEAGVKQDNDCWHCLASILRILRRSCEEQQVSPRVIGVDDWALRRGYTYGTVIVDLEARRVVDLLPDRQTATLQAWLKAHASVEIVSRDRSTEYAAAITAGSPNATQIADCWHLLANTRELAERYLKSIYSDLKPFIVPREQAASFLTSRPSFRRARADAYRGAASCARSEALYQEI